MSAFRIITALQTVVVNTNDSDAPGGSYWQLKHVALCSDGTAWVTGGGYRAEWEQLPEMPQGPVA